MDVTKIQLESAYVIKTEFEDCKVVNPEPTSSGYIRIFFTRKLDAEANDTRLELFFIGEVVAYQGEETDAPDDSDRIFSYKIEFVLNYSGEFIEDELTSFLPDNEWFFKKDANIFFSQKAMNFLSNTKYKNIDLPLQQ